MGEESESDVLHPRAAGLDVHQREVTACVRIVSDVFKVVAYSKRFETTPTGLSAMREWLASHNVTHVAMEGTGVYWVPVYEALRGGFDLTLCNALHVKRVPGRKTDQSDAAWLAQLMSRGMLNKSFVPPTDIRALRELTRARVHRVEDRTRVVNAMHRLVERAGLKLCSVVTDLQGATARAILADLAAGITDATAMAAHARGSLRGKRLLLEAVLQTRLGPVEQLLLGQHLAMLKLTEDQIRALDEQVAQTVVPYSTQMAILMSVPGIDVVAASAILAEIGPDMSVFRGSDGLSSWAGLAPGTNESAGRRKRAVTRPGNPYLSRMLVQVAIVLSRSKTPHDLTEFFRKKLPKLGFKKAAVATARKLLVRIWRMLTDGATYAPPPPKPLTETQLARRAKRHVDHLASLGFVVTLERAAA